MVVTTQQAPPDTFFDCIFNGVHLFLPSITLSIMRNCIYGKLDDQLLVHVESAHMEWLRDKLRTGDTFLDVGAATGAMTLPISKWRRQIKVIAFEPNRTANRVLRQTIERNAIECVEVFDYAVSDTCGVASFIQYEHDATGGTPWLSEASSLFTPESAPKHLSVAGIYEVPTITLDSFFNQRRDAASVRSVKIDVEGFEVQVLRGALGFLDQVRPFIAIDIHKDPFGDQMTEDGVRACLDSIGYRFEKMYHVLLCCPGPA